MPILTPEFAGTTLVWMLVGYGLALAFQLYMLYLNWKQSKVKDTTVQMIGLLNTISNTLFRVENLLKEKNVKKKRKVR